MPAPPSNPILLFSTLLIMCLFNLTSRFPTKVSYKFLEDGTRVRVAKRSGAVIPRPEILTVSNATLPAEQTLWFRLGHDDRQSGAVILKTRDPFGEQRDTADKTDSLVSFGS